MLFYTSSVFFGLPIVSCSLMINTSLIPGCLWLLAFVLNNTLILGIWCSTIPHLPWCFCPWIFFQNIGSNMVPSDPCMSHLATQLGYSAGEFQALHLIVHATLGVVDWPHFGNRFLNTSWVVGLTYWIVYLHFSCILTYAIIYVLIHHFIFWLYLYFLNILFFSSTPVLTSSIDVVFVLSIWLLSITPTTLWPAWITLMASAELREIRNIHVLWEYPSEWRKARKSPRG